MNRQRCLKAYEVGWINSYWIQNFINFRSKPKKSLSFWISALVLSSTQFIGWFLSSGLVSQTKAISKLDSFKGDNSLASTSPPITIEVFPMPVCTTLQYCALLLTISFSRFSMKSLDVVCQVSGSKDSVSNL